MSNLILHYGQSKVFKDLFVGTQINHAVAVCCRGWGKSHVAAVAAITAIFELLELPEWVPNKYVYIIAPTYDQVTDIYYPLLVHQLGMKDYCIKHSKSDGKLWFAKGVELRMISYEAIERMRGKGAYFVVNDEVRDWTKGNGFKDAWESIILPCIVTRWSPMRAKQLGAKRSGRSLTISTPKGYDYLYDMTNFKEMNPEWASYHFDYKQAPLLDPAEIEKLKHTMDPIKFGREYLASFKESGNSVFYCFDRKVNVRNDLLPFEIGTSTKQGEDVHIGIDFNVGLQCSSAFALRGSQIHYLDEFRGHPDTETLAIALKARYWPNYNKQGHPEFGKKVCKITVYPDPTGKSRKTSAPIGTTDLAILASHGFIVRARDASPAIVDSVNAVNRLLMNAAGVASLFVAAHLKGVIASLERTVWVDKNPDTATIDKSSGDEHFSDGIRYPMEILFPILGSKAGSSRGFGF